MKLLKLGSKGWLVDSLIAHCRFLEHQQKNAKEAGACATVASYEIDIKRMKRLIRRVEKRL